MSEVLFVVNAGSSSIKFKLYQVVGEDIALVFGGAVDGIGTRPRLKAKDHAGATLIERSFGAFDGQVIREVKERHGLRPDQSSRDVLPADADPWTEIFERIPPVIARWMIAHPQERLLFVAHSGVFDAIHEHMLGARAGPESRHGMPYLAAPTDAGWALDALL
mgnify:CR=1 FL=1